MKIECISKNVWDVPGGRIKPGQIFDVTSEHHMIVKTLHLKYPKDFRIASESEVSLKPMTDLPPALGTEAAQKQAEEEKAKADAAIEAKANADIAASDKSKKKEGK